MTTSLARKFFRAAEQRKIAADLLLREGLNQDAVYLAGYVVECALKSLLLDMTPARQQAGMEDQLFHSNRGHNFEVLKKEIVDRGGRFPPDVIRALRRVSSWSTALRYEVGRRPTAEAEAFMVASEMILLWVRGRLK